MKNWMAISLIVLSACSRTQHAGHILDQKTFERIYIEMLDSAAISPPAFSDSTLSPIAERILKRHEVTLEQFKATVRHYNADTKKWKEFFDGVVQHYDERRNDATKEINEP